MSARRGSKTEKGECKPLVTLCEALLRLFAGEGVGRIARVEIPEVLIGEISFRVDHKNYTNLRIMCRFFLRLHQSVTVTDNLHNSLHLCSFLCVLLVARSVAGDHNQDPRGIDW